MKYIKLSISIYTADHEFMDVIPSNVEWVFQGVYLHGKLREQVGNDLTFINVKTEQLFNENTIKEGIYNVDILDNYKDKVYNNCILYYWHDKNNMSNHWYRGLICFPDDTESIKDAEIKFKNKEQIL